MLSHIKTFEVAMLHCHVSMGLNKNLVFHPDGRGFEGRSSARPQRAPCQSQSVL